MKWFRNPGRKIKIFANVLFVVSIVIDIIVGAAAILLGILLLIKFDKLPAEIMAYQKYWLAFVVGGGVLALLSPFLSWVIFLPMYALGELVDRTTRIEKCLAEQPVAAPAPVAAVVEEEEEDDDDDEENENVRNEDGLTRKGQRIYDTLVSRGYKKEIALEAARKVDK